MTLYRPFALWLFLTLFYHVVDGDFFGDKDFKKVVINFIGLSCLRFFRF